MLYLAVRNFDRHQHYQTGRHAKKLHWIKLYLDVLNDYDIGQLPESSRWQLIALWCLAAVYTNRIPLDVKRIAWEMRATGDLDLWNLIQRGFITVEDEDGLEVTDPDAICLAIGYTVSRPDKRESRERERVEERTDMSSSAPTTSPTVEHPAAPASTGMAMITFHDRTGTMIATSASPLLVPPEPPEPPRPTAKAVLAAAGASPAVDRALRSSTRRDEREANRKRLALGIFTYAAARLGYGGATRFDTKREARLVARLKENGDNAVELLYVVDGTLKSDWHMGRDARTGGSKYHGIETIFRDREQVEKLSARGGYRGQDDHPFLADLRRDAGGDEDHHNEVPHG